MELVLKVTLTASDHIHYQDGDVIEAFSDVRIAFGHAEMICHPDQFGFNSAGLRDRGTLLEMFTAKTSQYKFTRVSSANVERLELASGEMDVISDRPNARGKCIHAQQFISRRLQSDRHKIFGTELGSEVWYGGNVERDSAVIDTVWAEIESNSDNVKAEHDRWPVTDREKRNCLAVNCVGFKDDAVRAISPDTAKLRRGSVFGDEPSPGEAAPMIAKRRWQIPYWDLASELSIDIDDVRDKNKAVDARSSAPLAERNRMDEIHVDKVLAGIVTL